MLTASVLGDTWRLLASAAALLILLTFWYLVMSRIDTGGSTESEE
jgi:hypothetical protein